MSVAKDIVQSFTMYATFIYYVIGTHQLHLFTIFFTIYWCGMWLLISKNIMLMMDPNEYY